MRPTTLLQVRLLVVALRALPFLALVASLSGSWIAHADDLPLFDRARIPTSPVEASGVSTGTNGEGSEDGIWRALPPPNIGGALEFFVDPTTGKLVVIEGYTGPSYHEFDSAGGGGWSSGLIGPPPTMNVSLGVVLDLEHRRLWSVGMDFAGYETGTFGEVELWSVSLDAPRT